MVTWKKINNNKKKQMVMVEFKRETFNSDPIVFMLLDCIANNHDVDEYTRQTLHDFKHVEDFWISSRHFAVFIPYLIHYDVSCSYKELCGMVGSVIRVDSIVVYDDFVEFIKARLEFAKSQMPSDN